jgi:hypothetical protein
VKVGVSGGSKSGEPAMRYRNAAIAWRDTAEPGRKVPSGKPPVTPEPASHSISSKKVWEMGTSRNDGIVHSKANTSLLPSALSPPKLRVLPTTTVEPSPDTSGTVSESGNSAGASVI